MKPQHGATFGAWTYTCRDGHGRRLVHPTALHVPLDSVAMCPAEIVPLAIGHFLRRGGTKADASDLRRALDALLKGKAPTLGKARESVPEWDDGEEAA